MESRILDFRAKTREEKLEICDLRQVIQPVWAVSRRQGKSLPYQPHEILVTIG